MDAAHTRLTRSAGQLHHALLSPFDRLHLLAMGTTVLIGTTIYLYCRLVPTHTFNDMTFNTLYFLGFTHFAVGYYFFFTSPYVRPLMRTDRRWFLVRIAGCIAISTLFYTFSIWSLFIVYTLAFLHGAEGTVYHISRMSSREAPADLQPVNTLFPLLALLFITRLSPDYLTQLDSPIRLAQVGVVLVGLALMRTRLPPTDWRSSWSLMIRSPLLIVYFLTVSLFFKEGSPAWSYSVIWHYVIWTLYAWFQKPATRTRLIGAHLVFGILYAGFYLLAHATAAVVPQRVWWLLIGTTAFWAQTACHILISFTFRKYAATTSS